MAINVTEYWQSPPPRPSPRVASWLELFRAGWRPNKRVRSLGYHERAEFYGVFIWEQLHVLDPALQAEQWARERAARSAPCGRGEDDAALA